MTLASPESLDGELDARYVGALTRGLSEEIAACRDERPELGPDAVLLEQAAATLAQEMAGRDIDAWQDGGHGRYLALCRRLSALLSDAETIARPYDHMEMFWEDAARQATGDSPYTFWDVYEHGTRRRLERAIACAYGAEDALLVNSGMSALAVALDSAGLRAGDNVHMSARGYFETTDLLERVVRPRGIHIADYAITQGRTTPALALFEVADATPGPHAWLDSLLNMMLSQNARIVIDNSMLGPAVRWPALLGADDRVLFVESTAKFLGRDLMGGVVYGSAAALKPVRLVARGTGQQLQAHAFHRMRPGEIAAAALRLELHERNVALLLEELGDVRERLALCTPLQSNFRSLRRLHGGCVFFLRDRLGDDGDAGRANRHRALLARWRELATARGHTLAVRAGYAWDATTARCYEGQSLKQSGVDDYIRISVGVESPAPVRELGALLRRSIDETFHG